MHDCTSDDVDLVGLLPFSLCFIVQPSTASPVLSASQYGLRVFGQLGVL